ncbi:hypothetical protein ACFQ1M_12050 [Sungkyunkwania multivorans]|uniref:Uncharacterized protein n=1 Tax=Sungkyunkwania multivorans TaxID=1173618 RepID=A0ABW3D286_9FLAO
MKITSEELKEGQELYMSVISKAWKDSAFKKTLIEKPVQAIEQFLGKSIDATDMPHFVVEDQTDSATIYLNIPKKVSLENLELSEEQLELIAGGDFGAHAGAFASGIASGAAFMAILKKIF